MIDIYDTIRYKAYICQSFRCQYLPWQVVGNEAIDDPADAGACEEEEKRPAATHFCDDERNRPAGDLNEGAKEVALVDVALPQVGSVLDVAVVAHEPHHAVKMFTFRKRKILRSI